MGSNRTVASICSQAAAEDLEALVRENQMIGHQLVALTAERDRWQGDMQASAERAQRAETLAHSAESEVLQLRAEHEVSTGLHRSVSEWSPSPWSWPASLLLCLLQPCEWQMAVNYQGNTCVRSLISSGRLSHHMIAFK